MIVSKRKNKERTISKKKGLYRSKSRHSHITSTKKIQKRVLTHLKGRKRRMIRMHRGGAGEEAATGAAVVIKEASAKNAA